MVKKLLIPAIMMLCLQSAAQQRTEYTSAGLLKANLALMQSFMVQHPVKNVYLGGNLEYFTGSHLSMRGDCLWYLDSRKNPAFKQNGVVLFGPLLHYPIKRSDFYAGLQPGFSFSTPLIIGSDVSENSSYPSRFLPALSVSGGYTFYFSRFCNFYLGVNYLVSRYRGAEGGSINLDEFIISAGLGFHLFVIHPHNPYH
ncbi:MAG: hypothetical protein WCM76_16335 [Bacteroidota bacterium]